MKILLVHKFLYPKGGAETYVLKLGAFLQDRGHEVQYFGLDREENTVGNRIGAGVSDLDFSAGILRNLHAPLRIIYNDQARRKIRAVLEDFQPDVVHLNNIQYHLTPSVIQEIARYRRVTGSLVRIVYPADEYQLICPSHGLFDTNLKVCEKCLRGNYTHCLRTKCLKNSYLKSLLAMMDAYFWKWSAAYDYIDTIICPSRFLKEKLDTQPRFRGKTVAIHNFVDTVEAATAEKEGYVLEFGHLSRDKGTDTLLEVAHHMPETQFVFAGFGEMEPEIEKLPNCRFVGFQKGKDLEMLIRKATVSVYPSRWYENCPFSVIESQMYGTPVIGARMGGIPELIREGETGELFEAGNAAQLEEKLRKILFTPHLAQIYRDHCHKVVFETPDSYCEKLLTLYGGNHEDL